MRVTFTNFPKEYKILQKELKKKFDKIGSTGQYVLGSELQLFEKNIEKFLKVKHVIGVGNWTEGTIMVLKALGYKSRDEIITVSNSFIATCGAIAYAGMTPKLIDVSENLNINVNHIQSKITKKTKAVMPVHLSGIPANLKKIKSICKKNNIPNAKYKVCKKINDVKKFIKKSKFPLVIKADGLAAGKGVTICKTKKKILKISDEIFKGKFKTSKKLIIEEFLAGEEVSYFLIVDKNSFKFFGSAQDHKRVGENDTGPKKGGMGAYSPAPLIDKKLEKKIIDKIVNPSLLDLKRRRKHYTGFLYVGIMIKNNEPYLIEYNVRMGDPECQVIIPKLKTDIVKIFNNVTKNKLNQTKINWNELKCMTIVLCSKGYPNKYKNNRPIMKIEKVVLSKNDFIYHAGTKLNNNQLFSNGGRVLNITSVGASFRHIRKKIISIIEKLNWKDGFYRKDIGWRVIK